MSTSLRAGRTLQGEALERPDFFLSLYLFLSTSLPPCLEGEGQVQGMEDSC